MIVSLRKTHDFTSSVCVSFFFIIIAVDFLLLVSFVDALFFFFFFPFFLVFCCVAAVGVCVFFGSPEFLLDSAFIFFLLRMWLV